MLWAILDKIVDDYAPVVEGLETDIEEVEQMVFSRRASRPTQRIYLLRREVTDFYRAVHPLLGPAAAITQGGVLAIGAGLRQYFRDVDDHLKLVNEEIIAQRDLLIDDPAGQHGGRRAPSRTRSCARSPRWVGDHHRADVRRVRSTA